MKEEKKEIKTFYQLELSKTSVGIDIQTRQSTHEEFDMLYYFLCSMNEFFTYTRSVHIQEVEMSEMYIIRVQKETYEKFLSHVIKVAFANTETYNLIVEKGGV